MSIDFSLNGSAMIIGNTKDGIIDYRYFSNMEKDKLFLKKAEKYHVFSSLERIKRDEKQIRFLLPKNQKLFYEMVKIHYVFFMQ